MSWIESIPWWRTLTIAERIALPGSPTSVDVLRASERSDRWQELAVFHHTSLTPDEAVAPLGLDWRELKELLGEDDSSLRARTGVSAPQWLQRVGRWCVSWSADEGRPRPDRELYNLIAPLVEGAVAELLDKVVTHVDDPLLTGKAFMDSLIESVPNASLSSITTPCLVQDMYDQRHNEDGALRGVSDSEVYFRYTALLNDDAVRERIFKTYPLVLRCVVERLEMWIERRFEFVLRLERDMGRIAEVLLGGRRPTVLTASFDAGDSHRRGCAVAIVSTDVGRFVYKPHAPAMEQMFEKLRDVTEHYSTTGHLRTAALVPGEDYFWQEFIEANDITEDSVVDTAERLGSLTALLHGLRSNDFHYENVVMGSDGPVPIDLESVLHTSHDYRVKDEGGRSSSNIGALALDDSCLGVGIIPHPLVVPGADNVAEAADISVVGYTPGRVGGVKMPHLVNVGTAEMRIEYERAAFDSDDPIAGRVLLHTQQDAFLNGFRAGYAAVHAAAARILAAVRSARNVTSRYIARPTMIYGKILAESYHPTFMRDALERHLVLGKLLAHFTGLPYRNALIAAELEDMLVGDIPIFSLELATGTLRASDDETIVATLMAPVDRLAQVLAGMDKDHLHLQEHIIRLAFGCLPDSQPQGDPRLSLGPNGGSLSDDKLEAAAALMDQLEGMVIEGDRLGTVTLSATAPHQWTVTPGGIDLYSGSTGVGLAALAVAELTGSPQAARIASSAMAAAPYLAELVSNDDEAVAKNIRDLSTGAYGQVSGVALIMAEAHRAAPDAALREACRATVQMLGQMGPADRFHDIISGNAGGILTAASVSDVAGPEETVRTIRSLADHLVSTAIRDRDGLSWEQADDGARLVGFSHGSGGVARALTVASDVLHDESLAQTAADAYAWESVRVTAGGDWPDLRPEAGGGSGGNMRAWCHGSPGAGYGRALLLASHPERMTAILDAELRLACACTQETLDAYISRAGDLGDESLCHGTVGNILCLEAMLESLTDHEEALSRTAPYWEYLLRSGGPWRSGARNGVAIPDLMMGLAGISWGLAFSARPTPRLDLMSLETR
ncbi:hypothetical protein DRB06_14160 [Actinomyces sp. Z5]|uniref:type 2 lanthipeptide synthetase LanM n=1 Tax=Actinomyces sp. Z5 TaxID=2250216 RepID=UPI000DCE2677|nr:type 2 lanthipeptide synthetase LanM [Actinomyces sp. Z5]RAX19250.1 hypothetical protein DRB06_14160 [Actinomyces sp. Z5]